MITKQHPNFGLVEEVSKYDDEYTTVKLKSGELRNVTTAWLTTPAPVATPVAIQEAPAPVITDATPVGN